MPEISTGPRVTHTSAHPTAAHSTAMIGGSNRMLEMAGPETRIIPGHGAVTDRVGLEAFRDLLIAVRDRIDGQIADGLSLEEICPRHPTAGTDGDRKMGMPPDLFVRIVYRDISQRGE